MTQTRRRGVLAVLASATLVVPLVATAPAAAAPNNNSIDKLTKAVSVNGVLRHLAFFQSFANRNDGNRASGLPGYDASADYVARQLERAGYDVTRQPFEFPFFEEISSSFSQVAPVPTIYVDQVDYDLTDYSGSGTAEAEVLAIDVVLDLPRNPVTSGCEPEDFPAEVAGKIALLQRGTCTFGTKVANAEAAGAVGAVLFNQGNSPDREGLLLATLGGPVGIPTVGVSFATGASFANTPGLVLNIAADTISEIRATENVIAESTSGDDSNVVMAGAHLDSVPEGPGINDNGSGSAALLEVALQMRKVKPTNTVRFAWWGAEEANLLGSQYYIDNLTQEEIDVIALYLNFDMVGSPNYFFGVYDGDNSLGQPPNSANIPPGSAAIEAVFQDFYESRGLPYDDTEFSGRSDYGPFIAAGVDIPAGGLFTGAEQRKTAEDVAKYGGVEGEQYDPCYHLACDSFSPVADGADQGVYNALRRAYRGGLVGNVNLFALDTNADAIATAVLTFANDTSPVNGVTTAPVGSGAARGTGGAAHDGPNPTAAE